MPKKMKEIIEYVSQFQNTPIETMKFAKEFLQQKYYTQEELDKELDVYYDKYALTKQEIHDHYKKKFEQLRKEILSVQYADDHKGILTVPKHHIDSVFDELLKGDDK